MRFFVVLIIAMLPFPAIAITLDEAVRHALENSEDIRIARESSEELRAAGDLVAVSGKPQLTFGAGYVELGGNAEESPYSVTPDRDISAEVTGAQLLYAGGRIWKRSDLRKNYHKQADLNMASGKRDIVKQVRSAFNAWLYRKAALDIDISRLAQREDELDDAGDLREVGMVTSLDVRQANLNVNFAKDRLNADEAALKEALIDFNLSIGRSDEEPQVPEGRLEEIPDMADIVKSLNERLSQKDFLDLETLKTQYEAAELNHKIAGGEHLPEIALVASAKTGGEEAGEMDESWSAGIQLEWNFCDGGLARANRAASAAGMRRAKEVLNKTVKELAAAVDKIKIDLRSAEKRIELQKEAVELSKKNYEDARGQYRAGTITLTRLGEFNLSYAEARFNLLSLYYMQREIVTEAQALLDR